MTTFMTVYTCKNDVVSLKHHFLLLFPCNFFCTTLHNRAYLIILNFFFFFFSDRPTRFSGQEIRKPRNKKIVALQQVVRMQHNSCPAGKQIHSVSMVIKALTSVAAVSD